MGLHFVRSTRGTTVVSCLLSLSIILLLVIFWNMLSPIDSILESVVAARLAQIISPQLKALSECKLRNFIAILYLGMHIYLYIMLIVKPLETPIQRLSTAAAFAGACTVALLTILNFWTFICVVLAAPLDIVIMCAMIANPSGRLNKNWIPLYLKHTPTHFGGAAEINRAAKTSNHTTYGVDSPLSARLAVSHPSAIASAPDLFDMTSPATVIEV